MKDPQSRRHREKTIGKQREECKDVKDCDRERERERQTDSQMGRQTEGVIAVFCLRSPNCLCHR